MTKTLAEERHEELMAELTAIRAEQADINVNLATIITSATNHEVLDNERFAQVDKAITRVYAVAALATTILAVIISIN